MEIPKASKPQLWICKKAQKMRKKDEKVQNRKTEIEKSTKYTLNIASCSGCRWFMTKFLYVELANIYDFVINSVF